MTLRLFTIRLLKKLHLAKPIKRIIDFSKKIFNYKKQFLLKDGTASLPHLLV